MAVMQMRSGTIGVKVQDLTADTPVCRTCVNKV
jgi:hypothetical protein